MIMWAIGLLVMVSAANAQLKKGDLLVGGNIGLTLNIGESEGFSDETDVDVTFSLTPGVTYMLTDNWYIDVDFYDINTTLLDDFNIRDKVKENKLIMIDEVNRMEVFDLIYAEYQDIFNFIYIITNQIANINSSEQIQNRS